MAEEYHENQTSAASWCAVSQMPCPERESIDFIV
jgi:hypothetical protein